MSSEIAQTILSIFENMNFEYYEISECNYKLVLNKSEKNDSVIFSELQHISTILIDLNLEFYVDIDGAIIIQ